MRMPGEIRTWIVMLHGSCATVFEAANPGGALTRIRQLGESTISPHTDVAGLQLIDAVAAMLETELRAHAFERLMLVGSAPQLAQLRASISPAASACLAAQRIEDLSAVPAEEMRHHVPDATWI